MGRSYSTEAPLRSQSDFSPFPSLILVYTVTLPCRQADMISQVRNRTPPGCCLVGTLMLGRGGREHLLGGTPSELLQCIPCRYLLKFVSCLRYKTVRGQHICKA